MVSNSGMMFIASLGCLPGCSRPASLSSNATLSRSETPSVFGDDAVGSAAFAVLCRAVPPRRPPVRGGLFRVFGMRRVQGRGLAISVSSRPMRASSATCRRQGRRRPWPAVRRRCARYNIREFWRRSIGARWKPKTSTARISQRSQPTGEQGGAVRVQRRP